MFNVIIASGISVLLFFILYSCVDNHEKKFLKNFDIIIKEQKEDTLTFNIAKFTEFKWDTLYIFKPYISNKKINEELREEWLQEDASSILSSESYSLFVFKEKDKIINYFFVPRKISKDFGFLKTIKYSKDNAKFKSIKGEYVIKDYH